MREILTIIAATLVALMTAALAGPWFIDWPAHRDFVDARLSRALGVAIATHGAIDIKLLPTPTLAVDGFELATADGGTRLTANKSTFELQVMPLLRGEFRLYDATIDAPELNLRLTPELNPNEATAPDLRFDRLSLTHARAHVVSATGSPLLDVADVDWSGEVNGLAGPYKGEGLLRRPAGDVAFRFATGAFEAGRLRLKMISDATNGLPRVDLDGAAILADAARPVFEGQANVSGATPSPWRLAGPIRVDASGASIDTIEARLGSDELSLSARGSGRLDFTSPPRFTIQLDAPQIDLDRLVASPLVDAARKALDDANATRSAPLAVDISIKAPAATTGGDTLADVSASLTATPNAPVKIAASVGAAPGGARLSLRGEVESGAAAAFRGRIEGGARDFPRFVDWIAPRAPDDAARLRALPARSVDLAGDFSLSAAGFSARDLKIKADRTTMNGAVAYTRVIGDARARLYVDLTSDAFDLDGAPDLSGPANALSNADLAITLDARAIRVARFGDGMIDAGRIRVKLKRDGDLTDIEDFSIADLGGANVRFNGRANAQGGRFDGGIEAERLGDLATFLRRVAPGPATDALATRAVALSPTRLAFRVDATRATPDAALALSALTINGGARGTSIRATARSEIRAGALSGSLSLQSPDAALLARQIGLPATGAGAGAGRLDLSARGSAASGFDVDATSEIAGANLRFGGHVGGPSDIAGDVGLDAQDVAPLLRVLGAALPDASAKPQAKIAAKTVWRDSTLTFSGIQGAVAGGAISGDLALAIDSNLITPPKWSGALSLARLSLPTLAEVVIGPNRAPRAGEVWPATPFAAAMAGAPIAEIDLSAGEIRLSESLAGSAAKLRLSLAPGVISIANATMRLGAGSLAGKLSLRRDGADVAASLAARFDKIAIERPGVTGAFFGSLEATATGGNLAALVAGLTGEGAARGEALTIPRADPGAPGRVLARVEASDVLASENDLVGALRREFDAAPFGLGIREFKATIASGALKLVAEDGVTLAYDFKTGAFEGRTPVETQPLPRDWPKFSDGPAPRVAVIWKGPLASPTRDLDAGVYVATLIARAIAREQARIEAFEADARERSAFARRRRGLDFMRQRDNEIAAWEAEQARLAAEAERQKALEAARLERERVARERAEREQAARNAQRPANATVNEDANPQPTLISPITRPPDIAPPPGGDPSAAGRY